MYMDKFLTWVKSTDAAATETKALPLSNPNLAMQVGPLDNPGPKDTAGMGTYKGKSWIYVGAGEDVLAGFTLELQHADTETGTYSTLATYGPTTVDKVAGDTVFKIPVPMAVKNFVKFTLSTALKMDIFWTSDVDMVQSQLRKGS